LRTYADAPFWRALRRYDSSECIDRTTTLVLRIGGA
jgi:hypothetical protein